MAMTVNIEKIIGSLGNVGYKNLVTAYQQLKHGGAKITATFNTVAVALPDGEVYEATMPSSLTAITSSLHNKGIVTPFVIDLNSFLTSMVDVMNGVEVTDKNVEFVDGKPDPVEAVSKSFVALSHGEVAQNPPKGKTMSFLVSKKDGEVKVVEKSTQVGVIGKMLKQGLSEALDSTLNTTATKAQSIAQNLFVPCGHIVCGKFDENMVKLHLADELLQPVYGTSDTSTYYCIALCEFEGSPINVAIRAQAPDNVNYTLSIRFEWKGILTDTVLHKALTSNGYTVKDSYASIHFAVQKADAGRAVTAMVYCLPLTYLQTAQISFLG